VNDNFTPIAGVNTFGLQPMDGRGGRPVAAKLRAAFQAAPPVTSGPLLPAREPFVPDPIPPPEPPSVEAGTLSDFAASDPAESAGAARLEVRDGALVLHRTGDSPSAAVYLYGRPVDLTSAARACVSVLDPEGGARLRFELRDTTGATTEITATEPTVPGERAVRCAALPVDDRRDRIDLARVDLATVILVEARSEQITIDDLTVS
jgi:hypothetical protein